MKYSIETTKNGCIETIELNNGNVYKKRNEKIFGGCKALDNAFNKQMEADGINNEDFLEKIDDLIDGFLPLDFMSLSEMEYK